MSEQRSAFEALVSGPTPLDRDRLAIGALMIAGAVDPSVDVEREDERLAELAATCAASDAPGLAADLFGSGRFAGNQGNYYDPENSVLPRVLDRGVGIPITLSVLFIDVARRNGLVVDGVGMPMHFLTVSGGVYYDVFHGGVALDARGCAELYTRLTGGRGSLPDGALDVAEPAVILQRMLWNLRSIAEGRNDFALTGRVLALLSAFDDAPLPVRLSYATTLAEQGKFDEAARVVEKALAVAPASARERLQAQADRWVARLN